MYVWVIWTVAKMTWICWKKQTNFWADGHVCVCVLEGLVQALGVACENIKGPSLQKMYVWVSVCVSERDCVSVRSQRQREGVCESVCVYMCQRESECVCMFKREKKRDRGKNVRLLVFSFTNCNQKCLMNYIMKKLQRIVATKERDYQMLIKDLFTFFG